MKRRDGSSRRQVLDLNNPSGSWKNKYQAIAERSVNGTGGRGDSSNALAKLVGGYASESDDEEESSKTKNTLDAKVEEFMKEVESTSGSEDPKIISCAWQECFDEGTGYPYYWNMNTNEVTWEPPPELVAYQAAIAANVANTQAKVKAQAQQAQWAVEQAALGLTPDFSMSHKRIPNASPRPKNPLKSNVVSVAPPPSKHKKNRGPQKRPSSGSEDEKIEMITSWVDEESEDDDDTGDKKSQGKKQSSEKQLKGVKPPPSGPSNIQKMGKNSKPAPPPSVIFGPQLPSSSDNLSRATSRGRNGSTEDGGFESKVALQKLRRLKTESDVIVGTRERVPIRKSLDRSRSGSPSTSISRLADGTDSDSMSENSLLVRLKKQVQTLKELGGSVPSDIRDLISSTTKTAASSLTSADNIIAMIEMEQPPDHKQDEKLLLKLKLAEKTVQKAVQKIRDERAVNGVDDKALCEGPKPASFALIAGYGDDSDQDDATDSESSATSKDTSLQKVKGGQEKPLFPILGRDENSKDNEDESVKTLMKGAPGCDSASIKPSDLPSKPSLLLDSVQTQKRKKRLDIGEIHSQASSNTSDTPEDTTKPYFGAGRSGKEGPSVSSTNYTTVWSSTSTYASDPTANDRRGFGFPTVPTGVEDSTTVNSKSKKGKIQFIKAETINLQKPQDDGANVRESGKESDSKNTLFKSHQDEESHRSLSSLAELVKAKLLFLCEGKEPVSPVQTMAIQIETLVSAWNAGALTHSFLQRWLQSTGSELVELERAAAPQGWAVQWDRMYKRYFYCNLATKDTQWDYPLVSEDGLKKFVDGKETSKPLPRAPTPPPDDEDAMELCTTPPPEEEEENRSALLHPPSPSHSPPPSKRLKSDTDGDSTVTCNQSAEGAQCPPYQPPLPSTPPPPLPSSPPPPPPDTPPPPPGTPPTSSHVTEHGEPLPPGVDTSELPFVPVRPSMPPTSLALPTDIGTHLALNPLQTVGALHAGSVLTGVGVSVLPGLTLPYSASVTSSYVAPPPTEAMLASFNHASAVDYMGYMGVYAGPVGPMPVTSVAAPPLAYAGPIPQAPVVSHPPIKHKKEALLSELNSFYSDIASLDSNSMDAIEDDASQDAASSEQSLVKPSTPPTTQVPATLQISEDTRMQHPSETAAFQMHSRTSSQETNADSLSTKKKKKPKLAPGLTLKKKGVSNLVAKWQQVQQEVWKDYQEEEDDE